MICVLSVNRNTPAVGTANVALNLGAVERKDSRLSVRAAPAER